MHNNKCLRLAINLKFPMQNATRRRHTGEIGGTQELFARDGRSARRHRIEGRMYRGVYRLCISIMGNYRGGNRSSAAWYNRTALRPRHVRSLCSLFLSPSLSIYLYLSLLACRPACLPAFPFVVPALSHAVGRVSQLSLGSLESPITCALIGVSRL